MASRRRRAKFQHPDEFGDDLRPGRGRNQPSGRSRAEIDLHGCTLESGLRRLAAGLARFRAGGSNRVTVITGKGHGSVGGKGVLGPAVEKWLREGGGPEFGVAEIRSIRGGGAYEVTIQRR